MRTPGLVKSMYPPPVASVPGGQSASAMIVSSRPLPSRSTSTPPPSMVPVLPVARAKSLELRPSTLSELSLVTLVPLLTASGALDWGALSERAVPLLLVNVVVVEAALERPRMNLPPVAATAEPLPITSMQRAPAVNDASLELGMKGPPNLTAPPWRGHRSRVTRGSRARPRIGQIG